MKNKTIWFMCTIILLSMFLQSGSAQSVKRQNIGSYGTNNTDGHVFMSQTIGQPFFTTGYTDNRVSLIPGFQQPRSYYKRKQDKITRASLDLAVYPNPASVSFVVEPSALIEGAQINITDLNGRTVWNERLEQFETYRVNSENWQPGVYFIHVSTPDHQYNFKSKVTINQ